MHEIEKHWSEIIDAMKKEHELSDITIKTWITPLKIASVDNHQLVLIAGSKEFKDYIDRKFTLPLKVAIYDLIGKEVEISYIIENKPLPAADTTENYFRSQLNPKYTFDTFVVGNNNKLAHAAALAISDVQIETNMNPLFIYGEAGLGKTHLMHSIAHALLDQDPSAKVLYITSEVFTNELIDSIRNGNSMALPNFRDKYRNIDVLLIDDIQFIIGKESTQEEFFHTFNSLHQRKKKIIISSDKPPRDIATLESRLRSRFEWGMIADIQSPDFETRVAILQNKQSVDGTNVDSNIIEYIAHNVRSNIRELEGSLNKICAYSKLMNQEVTLDMAKEVLKDMISNRQLNKVSAENIIQMTAAHFDVTVEDLRGSKKSNDIVLPRQVAMYLCRQLTDTNLKKIGILLGNRDHSTVGYGVEKISESIKTDQNLNEQLEILKKKIMPG
ncbi:MAG: chromosomal replication initiator protein DnaA [Lachnospiraceae bacterium]|nr:chromosomal replication initiator protein DnaA [Lachnospiraceae bacterium]MDY5741864.1 chromosomal replication initiator protein DnaA [Lachnospiraceae bacterium]